MKIIDISWPISPAMTTYKNNKPITIRQHKTMAVDGVADSSISMNMHTGTHIDAPAHFIEGGATIEQLDLQQCNGWCRVIEVTSKSFSGLTRDPAMLGPGSSPVIRSAMTAADLVPYAPQRGERLLL
ncbi:MAG: cyclase family protein, partial [Candidatus Dependentiae bacterium]